MDSNTFYSLATLAAIFLGPIVAVIITRLLDDFRASKTRKFDLFKTLMQTRGIRLDPAHVAALNIVELEFFKKQKVRTAFQSYIEHLASPEPNGSEDDRNRYYDQRSDLFMELLFQIGDVVGYKFDKKELERRSYVPKGWNDDQFLQRRNAEMLHQLLEGRRPLPISNFLAQQSNPFPDAPQIEDKE